MVKKKQKIAVAMSGGVDSSVAAALLVRAGHEVIGLFAKTWTPQPGDGTSCGWVAERRDALRVAAALNIPLVTVDAEDAYRQQVVDPWVAGYGRGETPNPDIWCNRTVKFGVLVEKARELGASALATGHYARIAYCVLRIAEHPNTQRGFQPNTQYPIPNTQSLLRGIDPNKDQSYFLWDIRPEVLPFIQFPIGELTKLEIRRMARQFQLPVAEKKDSQGVCLLGPTDLPSRQAGVATFLRGRLPHAPGPIYDWKTGERIGEHAGLVGLTIGQRHRVRRSEIRDQRSDRRGGNSGQAPLYIVSIDVPRNALTLGPKRALEHAELVAHQVNWLAADVAQRVLGGEAVTAEAQIRYRQAPTRATIRQTSVHELLVTFATPVTAPTPGQSVVFYAGDRLLGGAVIARIMEQEA